MKNKITKIIAALSFCGAVLMMMGCPSKKQPEQTAKQVPADTMHKTAMKDSAAMHFKALLANYDNHFNMQLMNYNDTVKFLDSVESIEETFFDCNMSNPTLLAHELNYNAAFAYILHFQNMYHILACAEIPETTIDVLRTTRNTDPRAADNCGLLLYLGIDVQDNFSIAYHNEANVSSSASMLFPRTSTAFEYFRADCQKTNRTPIPDPTDLNIEITRYTNICRWASPTATYTNDEITINGFLLILELKVLQPPIAFFHAQEIADLISQNDASPDPGTHCTGIRFYYGYDDDIANPIKIKLIAFAIDGRGNNIIFKADGTPGLMLEHSWPPF